MGSLKYFNQAILKLEKENISAVEVVLVLSEVKQNVLAKKENIFLPSQAMVLLKKLQEKDEVNDKCLSYLGLSDGAYEDLNSHCWFDLKAEIPWAKVLESTNKINNMFRKQMIDSNSVFDEEVFAKKLFPNVARKIAGRTHLLNKSGSKYSKNLKKKTLRIQIFKSLLNLFFVSIQFNLFGMRKD